MELKMTGGIEVKKSHLILSLDSVIDEGDTRTRYPLHRSVLPA